MLLERRTYGWIGPLLRDWQLWASLVGAGWIAGLGDEGLLRAAANGVGTTVAQIGTALLGVVLAGLAILFAFMTDEFIDLLERTKYGFRTDFFAFRLTATVAAVTAIFGVFLVLVASAVQMEWIRGASFLALFSFFYLLSLVLGLVSLVGTYARARVKMRENQRGSERVRVVDANDAEP